MSFRLTDPEFLADPAPQLARLRAEGALVRTRMPLVGPLWLTTTDAAARTLLKDPRFLRDPKPITGKSITRQFWWMPRFMAPLTQTLIVKDDPEHKRLRGLVDQAFARTAIEDLRPEITDLADRLLDRAGPGRNVDIVAAYTRKLPFEVISTLLGVPDDMRDRVAAGIAPLSHVTGPLGLVRALFRLRGVMAEFRGLFEAVRTTPRRGLISRMVAARDGSDALSEDELLAMSLTLFLAGHETTVHLINAAIFAMADDPALLAHFRDHPETRHLMIEEFLRHVSPVAMTKMLFAREDLDFLGTQVKKGEKLSAFLLAANYDPARAEAPERFVPDRRPNAHLGFGYGPHVCLGMQLARIEAEVALDRLFARYPDARIAGGHPGWTRRPGLRALKGLRLDLP